MKNALKLISSYAFVAAFGLSLSSCADDEAPLISDPQTKAKLSASTAVNSSSGTGSLLTYNGFSVSQFNVGTQNIEMHYYAKADLTSGISLGNLRLKSNLSASLQTNSSTKKSSILATSGSAQYSTIGEGMTPEGNYSEVNFKLYKKTTGNTNEAMYQKSLLITGEINGKLAQIWTESEKDIKAVSKLSTGLEVETDSELVLIFELEKLFSGIDFKTAVDGNGDGRIEISPNSPDGNAPLFTKIENNLQSSVVLQKR